MPPVTMEELAAAGRVAAAAVRIGPAGVSVRMPRLGTVRHGDLNGALRGCPCQLCDRTREHLLEQLLGDQVLDEQLVDQVDVVDAAVPPVAEPLPEPEFDLLSGPDPALAPEAAPAEAVIDRSPRRVGGLVVVLPAGLVEDLPRGITAEAGLATRQVVLGHAVDDADCVRLLLMLGLAAEPGTAAPADDAALGDEDLDEGLVLDEDLASGSPLVVLEAGDERGAAA